MMSKTIIATLWHNQLYRYFLVICAFLIGILLIQAVRFLFKHRRSNSLMTGQFKQIFSNIENKISIALTFGWLYFCLQLLNFQNRLEHIIDLTFAVIISLLSIHIINNYILEYMFGRWLKDNLNSGKIFNLRLFLIVTKILIWIIGCSILLDNLGFKITAIMAGLGIGGIALAFASQVLLKDLFSCFAIYFDKPFDIGDFVVVGDFSGTIEYIGIKTTRLISLGGEQLIMSNSDLAETRIRNYKRMEKRRVLFHVCVSYDTVLPKLQLIAIAIKHIIENIPGTLYDRAHLAAFQEHGHLFEVVYYVLDNDYNNYMDIQHKINLAIIEHFGINEIVFARKNLIQSN